MERMKTDEIRNQEICWKYEWRINVENSYDFAVIGLNLSSGIFVLRERTMYYIVCIIWKEFV
jgi:hypothetical protein